MDIHRRPNDARVAVIVSVLLESWSEGKHPAYFPRSTPLRPGALDLSARRWPEYGGNEGIWRLCTALRQRRLPAAVFANALSAERYPDAIRHAVNCGFDIAGHGYARTMAASKRASPARRAAIARRRAVNPWEHMRCE